MEKLFKTILGALIDSEFQNIPKEEVIRIAEGAIKSFKENF